MEGNNTFLHVAYPGRQAVGLFWETWSGSRVANGIYERISDPCFDWIQSKLVGYSIYKAKTDPVSWKALYLAG